MVFSSMCIVLCMDARFYTSMSSDNHNVLLMSLLYSVLITMSESINQFICDGCATIVNSPSEDMDGATHLCNGREDRETTGVFHYHKRNEGMIEHHKLLLMHSIQELQGYGMTKEEIISELSELGEAYLE